MGQDEFRQLQQKRRNWVEANRENNFEQGINHLLIALYPDKAHFIYELLQNAEDAQATEIAFCLTSEKLRVEHNATRLFTEQDIESITSIGDSTKRDDINKIGKFGVGFKAVFSYTDTPTIYSGNYAFKIYDLVVPELIAPLDKQTDTTVFEFPFNNPKKKKEQAFEEIANGLRDLSETTLLFLTHIKAINWHNENEPPSYTHLHTHSEHRIEIETCLAGEEISTAHYLRFMSQIPEKPAHLQVGLAYSLHPYKDSHTFDKKTKGLVSIFFPAEKETSNFRFHIHAPFAATVARDSIKDIAENAALITAIAELAVNSLHSIKTMGLLNRAFLDVLPNSQDNISEFYAPISEKIWTALLTQPLIPTYTGSFAAGEQLYHATNDKDHKLKKLLDSRDLALLQNRADEILDWCVDVPEALRTKIGIKSTDAEQLINKLINPHFTLSYWLELKENAWMQQFYSYLQEHHCHEKLKQTPLVRLNDGSHVLASQAYFPSDGIVDDKDFPRVCAATYESGSESQQEEREQAREFLKNIGVQDVNEREKIGSILKNWVNKKPSDKEYLKHLRHFMGYARKDDNINVFRDKSIFWGDKDGTTDWYTAERLFIDSPLRETGITSWFVDEPDYYLLSKKYAAFSSLDIDELVDFAERLGARVSAEVTTGDILTILVRWQTTKPDEAEYLKYLPHFISHSHYALFKNKAIFRGDSKDNTTDWYTAKQLFIDSPLRDTGITPWFEDEPDYYLLSKTYAAFSSLDIDKLVGFAEKLGARVSAEVTLEDIQTILSRWKTAKPDEAEYLKYLPQFISYSNNAHFKDEAIFWGDSKDGEIDWYTAKQLFIDSPPRETGITDFFKDLPNYFLLSKKYNELPSFNVDSLINFAERLGAKIDTEVTREDIQKILGLLEITKPNDADYLRYLPKLIAFGNPELFKNRAIFWGDTVNGETKLVKASEIFIDNPLQETGISTWYADEWNHYLLSKRYAEHISFDISSLIDFAKELGAKDRLPIIEVRASHQEDLKKYFKKIDYSPVTREIRETIDKDWFITNDQWRGNHFENWLSHPSETKAYAIWMTMCHPTTKAEVLTALYKKKIPLYKAETRDSKLVWTLRSVDWIPQIEAGVTTFVTPAKAIQNLLPEKFKYNDSNGWLTAIEFGKEEKARADEIQQQIAKESHTYQEKANTARDSGFDSPEEMEAAAALARELKKQGRTIEEEAKALLTKNNNRELPEESVRNPERRYKGVLERSKNSPRKRSERRSRSVQLGINTEDAKAYLCTKYTNAKRELVCQCCQNEMPFKVRDAYYFEAVQCIKKVKNHYIENRLALCPTCAAMYQHARATDDTELRRLIVENDTPADAASVEIPLTLATQPHRLRFVGTHFFDLKTVLSTREK
ncbi:MAG: hypothetical protein K9L60_08950 [Methylovulum sp.]|nr:hypothetical protein [Methylovulum sp.]MCF7999275.1 hypothetical protein [Methylovulum sp.]